MRVATDGVGDLVKKGHTPMHMRRLVSLAFVRACLLGASKSTLYALRKFFSYTIAPVLKSKQMCTI